MKLFSKEFTCRDHETKRWIDHLENSSDFEARKAGRRMADCGSYRRARKNKKTGEYIVRANWCKSPFCSRCQYFRSRQKMYYLHGVLSAMNSNEDYQAYFMTITPDHNSRSDDIKDEMKVFHKSIDSLFKNGLFSKKVGHYRNSEITFRGEGMVHHHAHFLLHTQKGSLAKVPGVKRLYNGSNLKYEIYGYFLRREKIIGGKNEPSPERMEEIVSELSSEDHSRFKEFVRLQYARIYSQLKKGEIPITMLISLAKKLGLGHQINIQKPDQNAVLELTKYNTKTIDYEGADMENLFLSSKNVRWHSFAGEYRKEKARMKKLELEAHEEDNDEWVDAGDLDELFEKELLKPETERDPEIMKLYDALYEARIIGAKADDIDSYEAVFNVVTRSKPDVKNST